MLSALTIWEINRVWGLVALFYAVAVSASTLLTKQHYVLDVVVSLVITSAIYYAYYKQRITHILGRNLASWEKDIQGSFGQWLEARLWPILERKLDDRVKEAVDEALRRRDGKKRRKRSSAHGRAVVSRGAAFWVFAFTLFLGAFAIAQDDLDQEGSPNFSNAFNRPRTSPRCRPFRNRITKAWRALSRRCKPRSGNALRRRCAGTERGARGC
ncbi:MAG: hypothetical protein M5R36_25430 [Deltaproteobacteria bacterium]|nr:hypothetical protein [Deltaproteobacteria bacterium]